MVASTKIFQCQQCGGAAAPVSGRTYLQCEYCRSLVFTTDNPLTVDRITPLNGDLDAECPTCGKALCTGKLEDRPVLYCGGCYGLLLKNSDFGAITRLRRARRIGCESAAATPLNTAEYERQIHCPNCRSAMEVHPYYGPGNIVIDSCNACQYIWLDHGELRTVECAEGSREPEPLPLHVNSDGDVTIIPPPSEPLPANPDVQDSPLARLADALFGF